MILLLLRSRLLRGIAIVTLLSAAIPMAGTAQQTGLEAVGARDELRWGVMALHAGNINDAIVSLNRSLSYDSTQSMARYWLGRAYHSAGFDAAALSEWRWIADRGGATAVLNSWIERVEIAQGLSSERLGEELTPGRLVTMAEVEGVQGNTTVFRRPAMVRPREDGYFYVVSFATHQVVLMDPNGSRKSIIDGGLEGFDRPFDVLPLDSGGLLVSEFGADRISVISNQGFKTGSFGETGRGDGQLLGPQYLTQDNRGFVYVSDYGNQRVGKFSAGGEFILDFGERSAEFAGLREPAGLVWHADRLYVSDASRGEIFVFDESGNYLGAVGGGELERPEAISVYRDGYLLVADGNRLLALDLATQRFNLLAELSSRHQIIGATVDANRNVIVSDFRSDLLLFMAPSEELYTGLTVEIDHVIATEHPDVYVAVNVTDRAGRPLLGLDAGNFRLSEDRFPTGAPLLSYAGYQTGNLATAIIVDRSATMADGQDALTRAVSELSAAAGEYGDRWLITAGAQPLLEAGPQDGDLRVANVAVGNQADYGSSQLDLAIRLAGSTIVRQLDRRSIVYVTDGEPMYDAFQNYGLAETAAFLRNNHISFSVVYTQRNRSVPELEYLVETAGGHEVYLYQPAGLSPLLEDLASQPSGTYLLRYSSAYDTDFGRRYIPVEVEAYLLRRSGRDESGYYGPLEF
jgi:hypothetical protein